MNEEDARLLDDLASLFRQAEAAADAMRRLFRAAPEGELPRLLYDLFGALSDAVAERLGEREGGDPKEWLDWFFWEDGAGAKALHAKGAHQRRERAIKTTAHLAALIGGPKR